MIVNYFTQIMAPGFVLGLAVLCLPFVFAEQEWPSSFDCERFGLMQFPFSNKPNTECGLYLRGCDDPGSTVEVRLGHDEYNKATWLQVESISIGTSILSSTMVLQHTALLKLITYLDERRGDCPQEGFYNINLPPASPIMSFNMEVDGTLNLYVCDDIVDDEHHLNYTKCDDLYLLYGDSLPRPSNACTTFRIPAKLSNLGKLRASQITIEVTLSEDCRKCMYQTGGRCGVDHEGKFRCIFQEQGREFMNVLTVAAASAATMIAMLVILRCCFTRPPASIFVWKGGNPRHKKIEMFLKRHELHLTKRYTYSEIREMTNSFKDKLGQGGYGSVYRGKLPDGRLVAVKVLNKMKANGEEFINEVASISQTSHVNVVSLFGFCFQGSKRALVYKFMPNGSLEKFIYGDNAAMVDCQLDCETLHDIAIGTARGLEYLHRGCNTRILHFDIKPHNILLDVDFCPKISDFGLAKICPRKESIVSMLGARGTAGYIAPEVISRNFGNVSHKSDVYSFGMMVLEMVGGKQNVNVEVECSSEIYFPHWIYKSLEKNQELALRCIKNENDNEMVRKMILVSLWCIQTNPSARPAMSKVVDMLEGSLELLQIPPKHFLSSPKPSPTHYSTSDLESISVSVNQ